MYPADPQRVQAVFLAAAEIGQRGGGAALLRLYASFPGPGPQNLLSAAGALHEPAGTFVGGLGLALARAVIPRVYREHRGMLEELRTRHLDWIAVRPVILTNGPRTGRYRVVSEGIPRGGYRISRADVADFMIQQLTSDAFVRTMPAIAN